MKTLGNMVMIAMAAVGPQREARAADSSTALPYSIVDTGQVRSYDDRAEISYPSPGAAFFGQDAQYDGNQPSYRDNGDGTVIDLNTGLMWQADPGTKKTFAQAVAGATACRTGGYEDWRLPTIKELYSLILFSGTDPDPSSRQTRDQTPFLDTQHFRFRYGRASDGDRVIDSQYASATRYVSTTMNGNPTMFGVNFADGRIKGYPIDRDRRGRTKTFYVLYVRGNPAYGRNDFVDNGDGSVTDRATGLTWMQIDSAALRAGRNRHGKLNWAEALGAYPTPRNCTASSTTRALRTPPARRLSIRYSMPRPSPTKVARATTVTTGPAHRTRGCVQPGRRCMSPSAEGWGSCRIRGCEAVRRSCWMFTAPAPSALISKQATRRASPRVADHRAT